MPLFALPDDLSRFHSDALAYACVVQNTIAAHGGCQTMSSEALNVLEWNAVLTHRAVRSLCEEGWTPITGILNRTLLDIFANCIAVCDVRERADYMGFKFFSEFYRKWLLDPGITNPERDEANAALEMLVERLPAAEQPRARELVGENRPRPYWFQPEYETPSQVLARAQHDIRPIYKMLSGITHGGYSMKILSNDDPRSEDIEPREHPRNIPKAIAACSRLLMEVCYVRDQWDNHGAGIEIYKELLPRLLAFR